jgi:hypothetical protein
MGTAMMKPALFASLLLILTAPVFAQKKAAKAWTLDDLLRWPGDYSQICDAMQKPFPATIPGFRSIMHGEAGFSKDKLAYIKANRAKILAAVSARLEKIDLLRVPVKQKPDPSAGKGEMEVDPIGVDPESFNTLLLAIIEETDGVEALPQLLALEEKFHALLAAAEKDPKAPLPQTDGDGAGVFPADPAQEVKEAEIPEEEEKITPERQAEMDRHYELFSAQSVHRDILAVCVRLMRKAGFEPMMKSDLEKTYGKLLKAKWGSDEELSKYKSAADIPQEQRSSVKFDPIHKVAYMTWDTVEIPYSLATRAEILTLTKSFIESRGKQP